MAIYFARTTMTFALQLTILSSVFCVVLAHFGPEAAQMLRNITDTQKKELQDIVKNSNLSKGQIKTQVGTWVKNQNNNELQKMYDSLVAKGDEMKNKFEFEQGQSNLSEDAKTLAKKVKSIITNDDLTFQQTCEQVNEAIKSSPTVAAELPRLQIRDCSAITSKIDNFFNQQNQQQKQ